LVSFVCSPRGCLALPLLPRFGKLPGLSRTLQGGVIQHARVVTALLTARRGFLCPFRRRITKLTPFGGFSAETAGRLTLVMNAVFGTHTITGAISASVPPIA
jgi:hypothetical protein